MSYTTKDEFTVLHGLRTRGMSPAEPVAESTGLARPEVQHILDDAVARGLARSRTGGRVQGYMLTSTGRDRHMVLRAQHITETIEERLVPVYEAFLAPNRDFKAITTRWQTEAAGEVSTIISELLQVHTQLGDVLASAASTLPRMKTYQPRFDSALRAFRNGDSDALAKPMSDSYHDVWMELHEDFLLTLGRGRSGEDE